MSEGSLAPAAAERPAWLEGRAALRLGQVAFVILLLLVWEALVRVDILPKFFFGEPGKVLSTIFDLFWSGTIYPHLWVTLIETVLAFAAGTALGLVAGLGLGLNPRAAAFLKPFLTAANAMPRVILAPIFTVWFGLSIASKVALGVTLVFFIVFFSVYNGVRDANPTILASTRMLGASRLQLIRYFYLPSAMSWVFASLHASVGMAFVGAVVGEYLGSAKGVGYLILQAESVFDINTVFAGIIILTLFALVLDGAVSLVEERILVWRPGR